MPQAVPLQATERLILGKKVKSLRATGIIPAHVFGKKLATEHVSVKATDFLKVYQNVGETGLVDLKIGAASTRPVLIRNLQVHPLLGTPIHIDFYQVDLKVKVTVPVPIILEGDQPELVHTGEAVVVQPLSEVEVEALPTDLPEHLVVNISTLKAIDDAIHVSAINVPSGVTILAEPEAVVVKLDNAVTSEMKKLMEEAAAATEAAQEAVEVEQAVVGEGGEVKVGEAGETTDPDSIGAEAGEAPVEAKDQVEIKE